MDGVDHAKKKGVFIRPVFVSTHCVGEKWIYPYADNVSNGYEPRYCTISDVSLFWYTIRVFLGMPRPICRSFFLQIK